MKGILDEQMDKWNACVLVPTYNNARFLSAVLDDIERYTSAIIVVNDGSTDDTAAVLTRYTRLVAVVDCPVNRGKGCALSKGFDKAVALGYSRVITMDSDGQHVADDLPRFLDALEATPGAMIVGSRCLKQEHVPAENVFANRFSNFWFTIETGRRLPDTQTGFRLYPLEEMKGDRPFSSRYEAELELLVRAAWRAIPLVPIPVHARYLPAGERVTHFRSGMDFVRLSLMNTCLVIAAIFYGYPSLLLHALSRRGKKSDPGETHGKKEQPRWKKLLNRMKRGASPSLKIETFAKRHAPFSSDFATKLLVYHPSTP
ncbi:MAG: glycosyltransferase family 2 protein [Odoribacteraceae bacterium]|jgi:glycosyltransferase involved in cell wall biosynthesis|nr:glycosyltransferase family 2 protein [Odoribacteraceae bacterium]